jgi:hypothetical protein
MSFIHTAPMPSWRASTRFGLLIVVMASILFAQPASAAIRTCRADPILLLSNGEILQTDATIQTDVANVQEVRYRLHLPQGVRVIAVIHTPSRIRDKEVVEFVDDLPPYHYTTVTTIRTTMPNVLSEANTRVLFRTGSATGFSGQPLTIRISPLL